MKQIYTEEFEQKLIAQIATVFGCETEDFQRKNALVVPQKKLKNSNRVDFFQFPEKVFVLVDPNHFKKMKQIIIQNFRQRAIKEEDVVSFFGDNMEILVSEESFLFLDPADFMPAKELENTTIKEITVQDSTCFQKLKESCQPYEWEEAYLLLEHGNNFGIWQDDKLLGIAGGIDWDNSFSDVGILIHPQYRQKGLGKSLLSALCNWDIKQEKILQFRQQQENEAVNKLTASTGFKPFMTKLSCRFSFPV